MASDIIAPILQAIFQISLTPAEFLLTGLQPSYPNFQERQPYFTFQLLTSVPYLYHIQDTVFECIIACNMYNEVLRE